MAKVKKHFIYVLRLLPSLLEPGRWTQREEAIVERHFSRLTGLLSEGKLVLAGKTAGMDEKTFGIVILDVDSEDEARAIMHTDPAVSEGVMTAELYPYRIALMRE